MASSVSNIRFEDGILLADVDGTKTSFARPCEISTLIGAEEFVLYPNSGNPAWTESAVTAKNHTPFIPLRGELGEFILFAVYSGESFKICGLSRGAMTLTIRMEDVWEKLPREKRFYSYMCNISHDPGKKTALENLAPDARIFLDLEEYGGFTAEFTPVKAPL